MTGESTFIRTIPKQCAGSDGAANIEIGIFINEFTIVGGLMLIGGERDKIKVITCENLGDIPNWIVA